jgi:hypothetical protein
VVFIHVNNQETRENRGIVYSVSKDEPILANYGCGSFSFYKRTR